MTAEDLRKAILQQAIQGKLVPQDPNDEPASVLLERIREEKARLVKEKKIKKDINESIIYRGEDNSHYEKMLATGEIKCIDDEIPFEIPNTWEWIRLGSIVSVLGDGIHGTPVYDNLGNVYFVNGNNLSNGKIVIKSDTKKLNNIEAQKHKRVLDETTILVSINGTIGNIAFYNNENIILGKSACYFNVMGKISKKYIKIIIESDYFNKYAQKVATGTTIKNVPLWAMKTLLIPLPPLDVQKRIAQRIEEIQPLIDKYRVAQEQAEKMDKSLNGLLKKSILQYAIQGKLVPQNSNEEPAAAMLEKIQQEKLKLVKEGKLKKKDLDNSVIFKGGDNKYYEKLGSKTTEITEEIPYELPINWSFVRLSNLCWLDDGTKVSGEKLPYLDAKYHRGKSEVTYLTQGKLVEPPCKAILVDGENSGEIFNITEKGYLGSTFKVLQISKCISEEWLHLLLNTYRGLFKNSKVGAAIPHLNKNLFRNLIVGLPPIEEQQRITDRVEKLMKGIEGI